jgi:hypothetical protein
MVIANYNGKLMNNFLLALSFQGIIGIFASPKLSTYRAKLSNDFRMSFNAEYITYY